MSQKAQGQQPFPPPTSICEQLVVLFFKTCFAASLLSWGWFHTKSSVVLISCGWCSGVGVTPFVWGVVNFNPNQSVSQKNEAAVLFLVLIVCPHQQIVIKVCNQDMNHIVTVVLNWGTKTNMCDCVPSPASESRVETKCVLNWCTRPDGPNTYDTLLHCTFSHSCC